MMFNYEKDYGLIFNEENIRGLQLMRLRHTVKQAQKKSKFYQRLFKKTKINPDSIRSLKDIQKIPITTKDDLFKYNKDFISVPSKEWIDITSTSGTTGQPLYFPLTEKDWYVAKILVAKYMRIAGVSNKDRVYLTLPLHNLWAPGLLMWLAGVSLKCCVLRQGPTSVDFHIERLSRFRPSVLSGLTSYLLKLGQATKSMRKKIGWKPRLLFVFPDNTFCFELQNNRFRKNQLAQALSDCWDGAEISNWYGGTEIMGVSHDCEGGGFHFFPESVYVEIVDPVNYQPLPSGEKGLLVFTLFWREGMYLIRYALGDLAFAVPSPCRCKRSSYRISPILGRIDHLIKVKGVFVYPSLVQEVLMNILEISRYYVEVYKDELGIEHMKIYISGKGKYEKDNSLTSMVQEKIRNKIGINLEVGKKSKGEIGDILRRSTTATGKTRPFIDLRKKD